MKKSRQKQSAALLALALAVLCACAPQEPAPAAPFTPAPESAAPSQSEPESQPDGSRPVTKPAELLGEPDEIVLFAGGLETALDKNTPEGQALIKALARRFRREKLAIAACAFEWDREDGQGIDWQRMAEDFDFIRLSYNREQQVNIQCMAVPEGFPPEEREAVFSTIAIPLVEGGTGFWVDRECYGALESSGDTLAQLRNFFPRPASSQPEEEKTPVDIIMDSYYLAETPELKGTDIIHVPGVTGDNTRLIPLYTTGTSGQQEMQTLLENLLAGEKLADHLLFDKRYYFLAYDSDGKIAGHGETNENFEIGSYSYFIEESANLYRWDFRYPELLESAIREGRIDPDTAQLKFCNIADFATGALLYDDTQEYFIPTVGDALHTVEFQVGTLYPVPKLAETLHSRINELFGYPPVNNA